MQRLSSLITIILLTVSLLAAQSPHGPQLKIDCAHCHSSESWKFNARTAQFSHDSTRFSLTGEHKELDCRSCHASLIFNEARMDCNACHIDVHNQTVGLTCNRCHTTQSWIVDNITEIHERTSFPLTGVHQSVNCNLCHKSETNNRFNPIGFNCIDCHRADYDKTRNPDHNKNRFATDCSGCHNLVDPDWKTDRVEHSFFPLTNAHQISDCKACHKSELLSDISAACVSCHKPAFDGSGNPNHRAARLPEDCAACHTTQPGWRPARFEAHDAYFSIYSGKHDKKWKECMDCHQNSSNYSEFRCTNCHLKPETDQDHDKVGSYIYQDNACLACHPNGDADQTFNHDNTQFPLTGAHRGLECLKCHAGGFKGTSSVCASCHQADFDGSADPNHKSLGLSNDCASCHSTDPGWSPARFDIHNQFYVLEGAHSRIATDCKACHATGYNNTPNTCVGCHQADFDNTKDPDHRSAQFPNDCASCHSQSSWIPSTFDHDSRYFPIFSGKHKNEWMQCLECHKNPSDYKQFSCISCHLNPETDEKHRGVGGYQYQDQLCLACHPTGDADFRFDHNGTAFPLTGAHLNAECLECHRSGFKGTPTICLDCHRADYDQSADPKHRDLNFPTDCASCHTTAPGWSPAQFDIHDQYYVLRDAHRLIANDCKACHSSGFSNTPNTCVGCHKSDFDQTKDPDHTVGKFPQDCAECHSEKSWTPSTFNHDGLYFPVYSGKHKGVWNQCMECHKNPANYAEFTCVSCHQNPETDQEHQGIMGYVYQDNACLACHPTGDADFKFDHNATAFPLTGAHQSANCLECHAAGFKGTSTVCLNCHKTDFDQSQNPGHMKLGISTDCISCHTTAPGWSPARFDIHDQFYVLQGAHAAIKDDCRRCHNQDYNNTPNTCIGCHQTDYNQTRNPDHRAAQFPDDCATCHSQSAWVPSTFDHDGRYFPIYSGKHKGEWNQCTDCHGNPSNYAQVRCINCHVNPETDEEHQGVAGYFYQDEACLACHPTGDSDFKFDHGTTGFQLTGGHNNVECKACHMSGFKGTSSVCVDCHRADFDQSKDPSHTGIGLSTDCISCHTTAPGWAPARFDIHDNFFVLDGAHTPIREDCNQCHKGNYTNTPNNCAGCHLDAYNQASDPDHKKLNLSQDCAACHTTTPGWSPAKFDDHNSIYPLVGAHDLIRNDCKRCHQNGYNNTPDQCVGCHRQDYEQTTNPNHLTSQFPEDCASCHSETSWTPSTFNHDGLYFPIYTGTHKTVWNNCSECHSNPSDFKVFTCIGCHINPETNDDHLGVGGYFYASFACLACHPTGEKKMAFDHNMSQFPLTGAHLVTDCLDCHKNGYKGTSTVCNDCHQNDFNQTTNPNHIALGIPNDCASCHTTQAGWAPARFDIHDNFYVLDGAHDQIRNDCKRCHHGNYINTPSTCNGCHSGDFNSAVNPSHTRLNLPRDCESCHTTAPGWAPATFNIHNNYWLIDGAHLPIKDDCFTCHKGNYNNTPDQCVGCHLADYNGSTNPRHVALNIPQNCANCHTTQPGWAPATFPIHNNYYVLQGAHANIANDCFACHKGNYNNTPNTCYGCHQADYNNTNNPDHQTAQFPTTCESCHNQNAWVPSTFNHDNMYFPIYSGKHKDEWNTCSECHSNPNNYSVFQCLTCHPKNEMDSEHNGVTGYSYNSNSCYSCHPDGKK